MYIIEVKMRFIVLFAVCLAAVAAVPRNQQRIVGGSTTTISQYPHIASLLYSRDLFSYWQSCGGTILTRNTILTATHCIYQDAVNRWRVRVGSTYANSGGTVHNFQSYVIHPNYNIGATLNNDIALMRTATAITYVNNAVQPGTIAGSNYFLGDNQIVYAAGWGTTSVNGPSSETLRHVQIWTVNQATCVNRYREVGGIVNDNMLCSGWLDVGGRDQCQGDSGGPLYHNGIVVGVCSWGQQCGLAHYPGVNARVSRYSAWIQNNA